ncbi:hypothetical protein LOZ61_001283 [Ophidiomyces ophidiicola]|uniref:Uncharacterized protein n=1 Tax=Ophidiomyces ophidiicola TaxID=1387563 RepID=A0ACB8V938_9EURO|nr:hypothetical protein LOZ61_001283 [Ophidiomyces ophidiicola]KAI1923066.1 hypothetical protein LOZ64_001153 [Ophidiomyces ophidiicola]KAI1930628.1 hypothetical protein LOZ60_000859 [Ophidiomyces ophidiicola]KAI2010471.1 hypothetical protein LOZ49_003494 [Ophidiomyces ophidiicola]KAI2025790.1 hypothetical protein LOZ46_000724 [Ophidiomyces ophidiicola]
MSANSRPPKPSKWSVGSLLQQAVTTVESRLDTILADNEDDNVSTKEEESRAAAPAEKQDTRAGDSPARPGVSRSSSSARTNERLQERLARAMVKQGGSSTNLASTTPSTGLPSRTTSPLQQTESRSSVDSIAGNIEKSAKAEKTPTPASNGSDSQPVVEKLTGSEDADGEELRMSISSRGDAGQPDIEPVEPQGSPVPAIGVTSPPPEPPTGLESALSELHAEHELAEARWKEELHTYIEKIDALQAKLKYLAKEAAESAKIAAATATPGSLEKKLLEKDERIAALMEEGQKLSKTELDHRATIKSLRQFIADNTRSQADAKRRMEKLEKDLSKAEAKAQRLEQAEQRALSKLSSQSKTEKDLEAITAERDASNTKLMELNARLSMVVARAEAAEKRMQSQTEEAESRRITELKDDLSSAKVEREISEEKLRREARDLKESLEREKERGKVQEMELRGELSVLESKMETLRTRAEEVSSSATGDAQAKLLRQIERLQTQYAVARENWNGIESSLMSRLANVEKERDEIARKEGDLRRKIREATLKAKRAEGEAENSREVISETERNLEEARQEGKKLEQKLAKAEADVLEAKQDLANQKEAIEATWSQRLEEEKSKWHEQLPASPPYLNQHIESPTGLNRRPDTLGIMLDHSSSRRSPVPLFPPEQDTPPRQNSYSSLTSGLNLRHPSLGVSSTSLELPMQTSEPEEYFTGSQTPTSPPGTGAYHSRGINDIVSASTVAAGPSVQLVERMSATVRRLESERAASKDELACITTQRDEARQEVVELMKEVEEKRASDARIQELESSVKSLNERYQTTLEMLGEKSELVEEQRADIQDLKKIYRELVESTMK